MTCSEARPLLDPSVDGELDLRTALEVELHVAGCADCARALAACQAISVGVRAARPVVVLPAGLEARVRTAVRREARVAPAAGKAHSPWRRTLLAAAASLFVVSGAFALWMLAGSQADDTVARDAIASHVRSLMADHLTDVPSSDQHTVKPWFEGKLDFAPPVVDLTDADYPLVGGRLDYVGDEPAAAIVYMRRRHPINLFVRRSTGNVDAPVLTRSTRGFAVVEWTSGGTAYCAVSDISADELTAFATLVRDRTASAPQR